MSLFDVGSSSDGEGSFSMAESSSSGSDSPLLAPPPPLPATAGSLSAPVDRNVLTEEDVRAAQMSRREQLAQRLNYRGPGVAPPIGIRPGGAVSSNAAPASEKERDASVFGNSIAAALQLRKTEQEKLLLKKLERERAKDAADPSLVERDMEVGVFVTSAYRQMLRRHRKHRDGDAEDGDGDGDGTASGTCAADKDDDEDPLEAYLQSLEKGRGSSGAEPDDAATAEGPPGDYYDRQMRAALLSTQPQPQPQQREEEGVQLQGEQGTREDGQGQPSSTRAPPSLGELQALVAGGAGNVAADGEGDKGAPPEQPAPVQGGTNCPTEAPTSVSRDAAAQAEHERFLHAARESRKRRRADAEFIQSCAVRATERILSGLGLAR